MHESWQTNHNEIKEDVERFEQMESGDKEFYFDVHSIENIFDFYADKNQFERAERVLEIGFRQHPNSTSLLAKQSIILMERGEDQQAISLMESLVNLEQSNPEFFLNLGWVYLRNGFVEKGIDCFKKTLEVAVEEHEDYLLDIALYLNQSDFFESTIIFLEQECDQYPNNENLLFELAFAYDKEGNIEKGMKTYNTLLEINPFSDNAWYNLGILFIKNKELDLAISCYDYALAISPSHAEALFNKGNALVHLGRYQEAFDCYIDYISYGYDVILAYHYLADCLEQMEAIDEALRFYRIAVETDPGYIPAWLGYLSMLINHEKTDEALNVSQKALETLTDYSEFHYLRARALLLIDDLKGARKSFEFSLDLDPENLRTVVELFHLRLAMSRRTKSVNVWKKWLKKYPESAAMHYLGSALCMQESNDLKQAAIYLNYAVETDPESYELFIELFPGVEEIVLNNKKLNNIIINNFDYEF